MCGAHNCARGWYLTIRPAGPVSVELLLARGADVNARTKQGQTPLMLAAGSWAASWDPGAVSLLLKKGADVVQPDNRRAGGPTEWMEIAAIADGFAVELASHGGGPANLNILCAIPNAIYMEGGGNEKLVNGEVLAPEAPGMSSQPAADFIAKHKVV